MGISWRTVLAGLFVAGVAWAQDEDAAELRLADPDGTAPAAGAPGTLSLAGMTPLESGSTSLALDEAFLLIDRRRYDEARKILDSVLLRSPENQRALVGLSIIHTRNYEHAKALEILNGLMARDPSNAAIKNNAAWVYATADDPAVRDGNRAVALAREALVSAPGSYHIWSTMAEGYYVTGQFERALETAQEAIRMAVRERASSDNLREYRTQIHKIQSAVQAFSLAE